MGERAIPLAKSPSSTKSPTSKPPAKEQGKVQGKPQSKVVGKAPGKPVAKPLPKAGAKVSTKPAPKAAASPSSKSGGKAPPKPIAKPALKPVAKPTLKPTPKPTPKPAAKPTPKPAPKPTLKPATKSAVPTKGPSKPAAESKATPQSGTKGGSPSGIQSGKSSVGKPDPIVSKNGLAKGAIKIDPKAEAKAAKLAEKLAEKLAAAAQKAQAASERKAKSASGKKKGPIDLATAKSVAAVAAASQADSSGYVVINGRRVRMISTKGLPAPKKPKAIAEKEIEKPEVLVAGIKTKLVKKELDEYKALLLHKRRQLVGMLSGMEDEALRSNGGNLSTMPLHMADIGTDTFDQDFTLGMAETERELLNEIDAALVRIENKSYGVCQLTGKPIPKTRLEAKPWAKYTVEAAKIIERSVPANR